MSDCSILLVAHEPLMRLGLRHFLIHEMSLRRCTEAATAHEALDAQAAHHPALVVLASCGASGEAARLIRDLRRCRADQRVLVVGRAAEPDHVRRVLQAGALGYVTSLDDLAELRIAVASVMSGSLHVSKSSAAGVMTEWRGGPNAARQEGTELSLGTLSDRELEVFRLVGRGLGCKEIAAALHISVKTVETHKMRMKEKLGLTTASQLLRLAMQRAERATKEAAA